MATSKAISAKQMLGKMPMPLMKRNQLFPILIAALPFAAAFWFIRNSRAAIETPDYKVVRTEGRFEIRDYPSLTTISTVMGNDEMNGGFMRLFRFITGNNERSEKISMTTPVLIDSTLDSRKMSFILPGKIVQKGVPRPLSGNVELGKVGAARFAVFRFKGGRAASNEARATARLKTWLKMEGLTAKGAAIFAYYDPPWTPVFMRRNEVMMRVEK